MARSISDSILSESLHPDRLSAWVDQNDHIFRGHRSRLAAAAPKIATLIATPNPFVSDHCRLSAEAAIDRGDDPVDVLLSETTLSREEIDQIAETVSGYADTHWAEALGVLGHKTKVKREVIERIAAINPQHISANWREHPDELHSLLKCCPTLVLPDTVEEWDVLHRYWNSRGPLEKDIYRHPKLGYLLDFQHLYRHRYPGISFEEVDSMFGGKCDLSRVWGYTEFVSKLLDSDGKPNEAGSPSVPFLSQFEPPELIRQADLCYTEMVRIANDALRSKDTTFDDWPRLINGVYTHGHRRAVSLVTPAELIREGAMLYEFRTIFPEQFFLGRTHIVAILSPEGEHLSTAEIITSVREDDTHEFVDFHFDLDGNYPSSECVGCVGWLTLELSDPAHNDRLTRLERRFAEPDQAMRIMLAQFKLKSAALGAEALSAVLSNCLVAPE